MESTLLPTGVTAPSPVTTTLLSIEHPPIILDLYVLFYLPQRTAIAPQVRPAPKPTMTIKSPSPILPSLTASDTATGIDAEEILPYFLIEVAILSSGMHRRCRAASRIRILACSWTR